MLLTAGVHFFSLLRERDCVSNEEREYGCLGEEGSGVRVCNGQEQEREAEKLLEEREKNGGEKKKRGPSNSNKLGPTHEFSPDLNPTWIQKQVNG